LISADHVQVLTEHYPEFGKIMAFVTFAVCTYKMPICDIIIFPSAQCSPLPLSISPGTVMLVGHVML